VIVARPRSVTRYCPGKVGVAFLVDSAWRTAQ
jgi:hypothetical protein